VTAWRILRMPVLSYVLKYSHKSYTPATILDDLCRLRSYIASIVSIAYAVCVVSYVVRKGNYFSRA